MYTFWKADVLAFRIHFLKLSNSSVFRLKSCHYWQGKKSYEKTSAQKSEKIRFLTVKSAYISKSGLQMPMYLTILKSTGHQLSKKLCVVVFWRNGTEMEAIMFRVLILSWKNRKSSRWGKNFHFEKSLLIRG